MPDFKINPYVQPYVGGTNKEFGQVLDQRVADYNINIDQADALGYQSSVLKNHLIPQDHALAENYINNTRDNINSWDVQGDYENLGRQIKRQAFDFAKNTEPLVQQAKARNEYQQELSKKLSEGKIGRETYTLATQFSDSNYKGYDPSNPTGSSYTGYIPSDDKDILEYTKKHFGDKFTGDKKAYNIVDFNTGLIKEVSTDTNLNPITFADPKTGRSKNLYVNDQGQFNLENQGRPVTQVEYALSTFIDGNKDLQNYRNTQGTLTGKDEKFQREKQLAITSELQRLGYNDESVKTDFVSPDFLRYRQEKVMEDSQFNHSGDEAIPNAFVKNEFDSFTFDPNAGKYHGNTDYLESNGNGSYTKFTDKKGNALTLKQVEDLRNSVHYNKNLGGVIGKEGRVVKDPVNQYLLTPEQSQEIINKQNERFDTLNKETFLADHGLMQAQPKYENGKFIGYESPEELRAYQEKFLGDTQDQWNSKEYRNQTHNRYKKALENFKTIEGELINTSSYSKIKDVGNFSVGTSENSATVFSRNLAGRPIEFITNNKEVGVYPGITGGNNDINSILAAVEKEGWTVKAFTNEGLMMRNTTGLGVTAQNPNGIPASKGKIVVTKKGEDGQTLTREIGIAVGITKGDKAGRLQIAQDVNAAYASSHGGIIPVAGGSGGYYNVTVVPDQVNSVLGSNSFKGYVQEMDSEKNLVGTPIPYKEWLDAFYEREARNEVKLYTQN